MGESKQIQMMESKQPSMPGKYLDYWHAFWYLVTAAAVCRLPPPPLLRRTSCIGIRGSSVETVMGDRRQHLH